jgi:hypothetical protein
LPEHPALQEVGLFPDVIEAFHGCSQTLAQHLVIMRQAFLELLSGLTSVLLLVGRQLVLLHFSFFLFEELIIKLTVDGSVISVFYLQKFKQVLGYFQRRVHSATLVQLHLGSK